MDPTIALVEILLNLREGYKEESIAGLKELTEWLEKDGLFPTVERTMFTYIAVIKKGEIKCI